MPAEPAPRTTSGPGLLTVYGSSSPRTPAPYLAAAAAAGRLAAAAGWMVVNGAGKDGCMGACTDACLAAGGRVRGVILRQFAEAGLTHPGLVAVEMAEDMRARKRMLAEGADAFLVLPGGPGTWEELWEIAVQRQIGRIAAPLVAIDVDGFWRPFADMLARAEAEGLLYGPAGDLLRIAPDPAAAFAMIGPPPRAA